MTDAPRIMPKRLMPSRILHAIATQRTMDAITHCWHWADRNLSPGERWLGAYVVPTFQRPLVWSEAQKIRLMESIYLGLPIGSFVVDDSYTEEIGPAWLWILDGQQRLTAITEYMAGAFPVFGYRYSELSDVEHRFFRNFPVSVVSSRLTEPAECRDLYERLVYGGTPHDPKEGI